LVLCDEIWTASWPAASSVRCAALRAVCAGALLLEDESGGQLAIA